MNKNRNSIARRQAMSKRGASVMALTVMFLALMGIVPVDRGWPRR